jgi:hypothetical protein
MSPGATAPDAVNVRRARARGVSDFELRREIARVATPRVERFIFLRRVTIRSDAGRVGAAVERALTSIAFPEASARYESFADFPALACQCAREAVAGEARAAWRWRALGVPDGMTGAETVAALLTRFPLDAAAAVAALQETHLLPPVWRNISETAARSLAEAIAYTASFALPPEPRAAAQPSVSQLSDGQAELLARAAEFWKGSLPNAPLAPEKIRTAAVLSLLRWSPQELRSPQNPLWAALIATLSVGASEAASSSRADSPPTPQMRPSAAPPVTAPSWRGKQSPGAVEAGQTPAAPELSQVVPALTPELAAGRPTGTEFSSALARGAEIHTQWGGVLFLINSLRRLDIEARLAALGPAAPTGWRLLLDLGASLGLPEEEPLALFLASLDLGTVIPPRLLHNLLEEIEALYAEAGPWALPLAQLATLRATESHLDLHLHVDAVSIALRLAGLDLNPGWTPWLGRVVTFHYDRLQQAVVPLERG